MQLPGEFITRLKGQLGDDEYGDYLKSFDQDVPVSFRINPMKVIASPTKFERVPWSEYGYYLPERPRFFADPLLHAGAYYVQEASSMIIEAAYNKVFENNHPKRVLDLCGAPGGKSTHLLSLIPYDSFLVTNEVIRSRANILSENIQKWGYSNVVVTNSDPQSFNRLRGFFDLVVVDAPCSGEGMFRKDPVAINEWSVENTRICSSRQKRIVSEAWNAVAPGGYMFYSTCTFNPEENEQVVEWICNEFEAEPVDLDLNNFGYKNVPFNGGSGVRAMHQYVKGEGFFLGVVKKTGDEKPVGKVKKNKLQRPSKNETGIYSQLVNRPMNWLAVNGFAHYTSILNDDLIQLIDKLNIVMTGVNAGTIKNNKFVPSHSLALSTGLNRKYFPVFDLHDNQVLAYLRKDNVQLDIKIKGWVIVLYKGIPIGFVKNVGNRINNYYPMSWRIRDQIIHTPENILSS